jgi:hypothetical protein
MTKNYDLAKLRELTSKACDLASESGVRGAINFGDLRCVTAEQWTNDEGITGYRVWIEEAAPGNVDFHYFVYDYLTKAGFIGIEVETRW